MRSSIALADATWACILQAKEHGRPLLRRSRRRRAVQRSMCRKRVRHTLRGHATYKSLLFRSVCCFSPQSHRSAWGQLRVSARSSQYDLGHTRLRAAFGSSVACHPPPKTVIFAYCAYNLRQQTFFAQAAEMINNGARAFGRLAGFIHL